MLKKYTNTTNKTHINTKIIYFTYNKNRCVPRAFISSTGIFVAIWVKIIHFYFMPKIIRILRSCSMKIFCKFPTVNIWKTNFWLVICIVKNFIWRTLKMIFSIFRFFGTLRFQIYKYCLIITHHKSMEILFIQMVHKSQLKKWTLMTSFVVQGHI